MDSEDIDIIEKYETYCNLIIEIFQTKHGYEFSYWICDEVGGIAVFIEEYYFNMSDIMYDLRNELPIGLIFEWQDHMVDNYSEKDDYKITLSAFSKGMI